MPHCELVAESFWLGLDAGPDLNLYTSPDLREGMTVSPPR